MTEFIKGMQLCEKFYSELVKPLIEGEYPGMKYSAGISGSGSEVLGFDTELSTDHHWGPRVMLFLRGEDIGKKEELWDFLSRNLPTEFCGYSTHFGKPDEIGVQLLRPATPGEPINHRIEVFTIKSFFEKYLHIDPDIHLEPADWLVLSEQKLRTIRSSRIFHDGLNWMHYREKFHYYPHDVWLYLLASEWSKIAQEEPFMGRCGEVGDETGSRIITARLVESVMRLCFLTEKEYAPYSKWFGTAFSRLKCAGMISPLLEKALSGKDWKEREARMSEIYGIIAEMHNELQLTEPVKTEVSSFHDRPYMVIHGEIFAEKIKKLIKDPAVRKITGGMGSVNQFSNNTDLLTDEKMLKRLRVLYE